MVVMSLEKYFNLAKEVELEQLLNLKFGNPNIEDILEETEKLIESSSTEYMTHDNVFSKLRSRMDE